MLAFMQACQTVGAIVNFVEDAGRQPISGCTRPTCVGDIRAYMGPGRLAPPPPSGMRLSAEAHGLWPSPRRVVYLGGGGGPAYHALSAYLTFHISRIAYTALISTGRRDRATLSPLLSWAHHTTSATGTAAYPVLYRRGLGQHGRSGATSRRSN